MSYSIKVFPPQAPATVCDFGSELNCGFVAVEAEFAGLAGRTIEEAYPHADLIGSVGVTRTYGCQSQSGRRLHHFDVKVHEVAPLATRRSSGMTFVEGTDSVRGATFALLQDAQPGNCPGRAQAMTYAIKAQGADLELVSNVGSVPDANYGAPGRVSWKGAVPTPSLIAQST